MGGYPLPPSPLPGIPITNDDAMLYTEAKDVRYAAKKNLKT